MRSVVLLLILFTYLTNSAWASSSCGLKGSVKERISACDTSVGPGNEFQLVTRTLAGDEIYKGRRTGVIWSADLAEEKNFLRDEVQNICARKNAAFGGLNNLKWILPSAQRYIQALKYGIQSSIPGMISRDFWTSTADSFYVNSRYIFEGSNNYRENSNGIFIFRHLEVEMGLAYVKCIVETI